MKRYLPDATATLTMRKEINWRVHRVGDLRPSPPFRGDVGRCRALYGRASTHACSNTNCSSVTTDPTGENRSAWFGAPPAALGGYLKPMSSFGSYINDFGRTVRCRSTYNRKASESDPEACSCDHSDGSAKLKGGDRQFIWRTTKDRFIDFCFSREEKARLKLCHERIIASSWCSVTAEEVAECLVTQGEREGVSKPSLLQQLRHFWGLVLSPWGLEEGGRRLFRTVIPCYENTVLTANYFGIGEADFNSRIYFLLMHVWSLHCALQKAGLETLKIKLWDAFWDFLTNILIQEGVSEFRIPAVLREQQFTSLGFCVSLDEAFEDESAFPAGQLAHRLWVTVFDAKEKRRDCPELMALTTYSLRARDFALQLPREALELGAFRWPAWPPVNSSSTNRANNA